MMAEDGITMDNMEGSSPLSLNGAYRKIIAKPENLTWELVSYTDETVRLFDTDLDILRGIKNGAQEGAVEAKQENKEVKRALKVEVSLGSSCYATIFARELTKGHVDMEWSRDAPALPSE